MMKKTIIAATLVVAFGFVAMPAQAQFGKALKNVGKAAQKQVTEAASNMAGDMAAEKISTKMVEWMDANNTIAPATSEYTTRLNKLVGDKFASVDGMALNYKVYENPEMNIIPSAEGSIRVYSGMMDQLTDDELVAAIAIQIAHINNKDVRDALMTVAKGDNATDAGSAQLEKMLSFSGDKLGSVVNEIMQVPYSDEQNQKADKSAYALLKEKKVNAEGLTSLLNKLAEIEDSKIEAEEEEEAEVSPAAKYIKVNSNNSIRASLIESI